MKTLSDLSAVQLRRAAQIKEQIAALEKEMQSLLGSNAPAARSNGGISAAGRAKISAALKERWARVRADKARGNGKTVQSSTKPTPKAAPQRKTMSAAQKAKIGATMRARWAKIKAAKR